ncbi:hypothetical protein ABZ826_18410 [Streptomyces sp. NPDC047515]|uniref:hypothetical protein n=1 Tax=Streptomyces sp. NPDC047515 TaxID=3155380 RepID=UPI0034030231
MIAPNAPGSDSVRLLPWSGVDGNPCYVLGDGTGYVSRVADNVESVQLGMAAELLDHVDDMFDDSEVTSVQLRYVVARVAEALRDVCRIAESRGLRLRPSGQGPGVPDADACPSES